MLKRVLAWIALIFLLLIIANILFIHVYVTESVAIFLLYVLVLYFGRRREYMTEERFDDKTADPPAAPETAGDSETGDNADKPERLE